MKAKGLLLKSYGIDGGLFPKMFFDDVTQKLTIVELDGTRYESTLKKIRSGSYTFTPTAATGTFVFEHGFGTIPNQSSLTYSGGVTTTGSVVATTTTFSQPYDNAVAGVPVIVTWKAFD